MPVQEQNISLSFLQGIDTKNDPWQIPIGKFASLKNVQFNTPGLIGKTNGFKQLTTLPAPAATLTTFNGGLVALGSSLYSYSSASQQWLNKGRFQPAQLSVLPTVRTALNQSNVDTAVASTGSACVVFLDGDGSYKYRIVDSVTGQELVAVTSLPAGANFARVNALGSRFVITFLITVTATPHLQYIAIPFLNLTSPTTATDIATTVRSTSASGYDAVVANNTLYVAWDASDGGGAIRLTYLTQTLTQGNVVVLATAAASLLSLAIDVSGSTPVIWLCFLNGSTLFAAAYSNSLVVILGKTSLATGVTVTQIASTAQSNVLTFFYQVTNTYSYSAVRSDFIDKNTVTLAGVVGSPSVMIRSVGLASKAALVGTLPYMLVAYGGSYQPSYFLIDGNGNVVAKLAYSNGGGYITSQVLPQLNPNGTTLQTGYLYKDLVTAVNRTVNATQVAGIYAQLGVNLATFNLSSVQVSVAEIGGALHIGAGFLWMYDGSVPVEHNFHVFPEDMVATTITTGGSLANQQYFYQAVYEWTDASGNIHRSAPSVPITITTTGAGTSTNTINVPTLRLTYKIANVVRLTLYRWSAAQQSFYQVTSVSSPTLNNPAADSIAIVDTLSDAAIIGNALIYTTGGVVENIAYPAVAALTLYRSRLIVLDAEDRNLLWYSKQVIENTPVEPSDLFTIFVPPTTGAQGSTGMLACLAPMDDKLILTKSDALYYTTGQGPDNTGAGNDFSDAIFIASTVGSTNPESIVLTPIGLMFDSDKGKWLLGRDLSTSYIGADVEAYNSITVTSAVSVPATNQIRMTLNDGMMLQYDYYMKQWNTPDNIQALSSTLYQSLHTYLTQSGAIFQESPGSYVIGSTPVLMSFTTGWINIGGVQGFQRMKEMFLTGRYITPHKLQISFAYDYNSSPSQSIILSPDNYTGTFGSDPAFGQSTYYGGNGDVESWQIYLQRQKCEAVQITIQEIYDSSFGVPPGAGLTISNLDLTIGLKDRKPRRAASRSVG